MIAVSNIILNAYESSSWNIENRVEYLPEQNIKDEIRFIDFNNINYEEIFKNQIIKTRKKLEELESP